MKVFPRITSIVLLLATVFFIQAVVAQEKGAEKPNIIIILADDLGWSDLGCTGSEVIKTPNIDRLADNGVLFTSAYVTGSVCAPSRAGLLTGRFPQRLDLRTILLIGMKQSQPRSNFMGLILLNLQLQTI